MAAWKDTHDCTESKTRESNLAAKATMSDGALPSRTAILKRQEEQTPAMVCQERELSYC